VDSVQEVRMCRMRKGGTCNTSASSADWWLDCLCLQWYLAFWLSFW
jgi:hypothetical protein